MVPSAFTNFFVASAGAGGALVGLIFVAVSIAPEHIVQASAPVERQAVAASAGQRLFYFAWRIDPVQSRHHYSDVEYAGDTQ